MITHTHPILKSKVSELSLFCSTILLEKFLNKILLNDTIFVSHFLVAF